MSIHISWYVLYSYLCRDVFNFQLGIQAVQNPEAIGDGAATWYLCPFCFIEDRTCLWCCIQWAAGNLDAVLVACIVGLWNDIDWVAWSVCEIYSWAAQRYTEASATKARERGEKYLEYAVLMVVC